VLKHSLLCCSRESTRVTITLDCCGVGRLLGGSASTKGAKAPDIGIKSRRRTFQYPDFCKILSEEIHNKIKYILLHKKSSKYPQLSDYIGSIVS
jgi:hypothetical protein